LIPDFIRYMAALLARGKRNTTEELFI